jgi:hypothetical protein
VTHATRHPDDVLQDALAAELIAVLVVGSDDQGRIHTLTSETVEHARALARIAQIDLDDTPLFKKNREPVS